MSRGSSEPSIVGMWTQVGNNLKGVRGDTEGYENCGVRVLIQAQ